MSGEVGGWLEGAIPVRANPCTFPGSTADLNMRRCDSGPAWISVPSDRPPALAGWSGQWDA